ncbi:hypothetical protein [Paenibacillus ginsengihumi]|uniref:hypothetical protein n=1 Tax=Paenibacillus ginsengihumi TaxID=431596 RepID=UPI00037073D1|nr:hypothetical protein [Paenibacillus ginsengihumi]
MSSRTVANIYQDTRDLLNRVKSEFDFKSDDQAVKYLCLAFLEDERSNVLRKYVAIKTGKEQEG